MVRWQQSFNTRQYGLELGPARLYSSVTSLLHARFLKKTCTLLFRFVLLGLVHLAWRVSSVRQSFGPNSCTVARHNVTVPVCACGLGMVAMMYWQLHRQFLCLQLELQRLSRQYRRTRRNCIKIHQRLNTVEEIQADQIGQDGFLATHWRAGSKGSTDSG